MIFSQNSEQLRSFFTPEIKQNFNQFYGDKSSRILDAWLQLIEDNQDKPTLEKLGLVNHFFNNRINFINDIDH